MEYLAIQNSVVAGIDGIESHGIGNGSTGCDWNFQ
jgi:hypothetical protein